MTPLEWLAVLCATGSVFFFGLATLGLFRLPDVFARAHATSKADTLGTLLGVTATGLAAGAGGSTVRLVLLVSFVLVTTPTATHAIVRAGATNGDGVPTATGAGESRPPGSLDGGRSSIGGDGSGSSNGAGGERPSTEGDSGR